MRFTTHRIVKNIPEDRNKWDRLKLENTIFLNVTSDFIWYVREKFSTNDCYTNSEEITVYYTKSKGEIKKGSCVLIYNSDSNRLDLMELEYTLLSFVDDSFIEGGPGNKAFYNTLGANYVNMKSAEKSLDKHKNTLISKVEKLEIERLKYLNFKARYSQLKKLDLLSGIKKYIFENVIAEDVDAVGEDIDLGTLEFEVNFLNGSVQLLSGSNIRNTGFNDRSVHPHQMSSGICLGSQEADFYTAVREWEVSIVEAILYKFAHSYASGDSAGRNYILWTQDLRYVDYKNKNYPTANVVFSEHSQSWVLKTDAIELPNGQWAHKDHCSYSTHLQKYILEADAIFSHVLNSYIPADSVVELQNGKGFVPADYEFMSRYRRKFYHNDDTVEVSEGTRVPTRFAVFSDYSGKYMMTGDAVEFEGKYYTPTDLDTYKASLVTTIPTPSTEVEEAPEELSDADATMERILADGGSMTDVYRNIVG